MESSASAPTSFAIVTMDFCAQDLIMVNVSAMNANASQAGLERLVIVKTVKTIA